MKRHILPLLIFLAVCRASSADVLETSPNAFTVESSVLVKGAPDAVYAALIKPGTWWDPAHTWSGDARNLSIDARAGGCFCETLPNGGSVEHARVIFAQPGKLLRFDAALGPFQAMPVKGVLTFSFKIEEGNTRVTVNYRVAGTFTMESAQLAPGADGMLAGQMQRFKRFIETGKPIP
ncbi:MAG TPA: SRPBCC domain-containing protein [Steroidobacteraceae bacterium]|jgi:uncharacterized protein YndB with AHSA1/START domain|nr:SRPBCC domain-containing protein [Steroidobacteraceae bacterium]